MIWVIIIFEWFLFKCVCVSLDIYWCDVLWKLYFLILCFVYYLYGVLYKKFFFGIVWWNVVLNIVIWIIFDIVFLKVLILIMFVGLWSGVKLFKDVILIIILLLMIIDFLNNFLFWIIWCLMFWILFKEVIILFFSKFLIIKLIVIEWFKMIKLFWVLDELLNLILNFVFLLLIFLIKLDVILNFFGICNNWNFKLEFLVLIDKIFIILFFYFIWF